MMTSSHNYPPQFFKDIAAHCNTYKGADKWRSIFQLVTTVSLFVMASGLMLYSLNFSYWITLFLSLPTAGLMARIFIFQHDCGHGSFFTSKPANDWTGRFLSMITAVPYDLWRRSHNLHHATSGNLDRCGVGDIDVITVKEYEALSKMNKFIYRLYRNPFALLLIGTPLYTIILQRFPYSQGAYFRETYKTLSLASTWKSTMLTNAGLVVFYGSLAFFIGIVPLISVALPILIVAAWFYGWAFFVQHQFEDTYWETNENWNIQEAALMGSSYFVLPRVLQWFSGNIGFHHIHHMCSKIPNYKLQECMEARPELKEINRITLLESLKCASLKLWDEDKQRLVTL